MFQPGYFKQESKQQMLRFIEKHSLASIVSLSSQGLIANHIPMIIVAREEKFFLQGHVAKVNNIWQDYDESTDVLAIFHGPDAYISPNWYPSKKVDGKAVPTWNYVAVHVSGRITFFQDKQWLSQHLDKLSHFNEKSMSTPWKIRDAPKDYIEKMLMAIVGLEIEIKDIKGNTKMSQNHCAENRAGVIEGLNSFGKTDVACWVEKPNNICET
ncbi:MAG: FMN-binding negative transcriptional regulator [Alcanivoracaceae bacterium]|nr:FMN-binding negative transcriptional regulator [Alcanivoracaceae bacterium]